MNLNFNVDIQRSDGVAALGIPRERLEAIAQEVAQVGFSDPHWSKQRRYSITLAYEWGPTPLNLLVRRDESKFDVCFVLKSEIEQLSFRLKEE